MNKYHLVVLHGAAFLALPISSAFLASGCDVHDNTINIPNATINATADVDVDVQNVAPEQMVAITMDVQNVYLIAPEATPPPEHVADAGHIQVYMDSVSNPPIMVTAEAHIVVKIPAATTPGKHRMICRVHRHDGQATNTKTEIQIDVKASVTIGGGDAGTPDATGTTPDATGATPDAGTADAATDAVAAAG